MIVSQRHRLVFFHNPKVAGASVHKSLESLHDIGLKLWGLAPDGRELSHFGIDEFAATHPETWAVIRDFAMVSLYRDPQDRFLSSVAHHSKMYGEIDVRFAPDRTVRKFVMDMVAKLDRLGTAEAVMEVPLLRLFRPQWIYLRSEREEIDLRSFPISRLEDLYRTVEARIGRPVERVRVNERERLRLPGPLARLLASGSVSRGLGRLPGAGPLKAAFRRRFARAGSSELPLTAEDRAAIRQFVDRFYARDFREIAALQAVPEPAG